MLTYFVWSLGVVFLTQVLTLAATPKSWEGRPLYNVFRKTLRIVVASHLVVFVAIFSWNLLWSLAGSATHFTQRQFMIAFIVTILFGWLLWSNREERP